MEFVFIACFFSNFLTLHSADEASTVKGKCILSMQLSCRKIFLEKIINGFVRRKSQ